MSSMIRAQMMKLLHTSCQRSRNKMKFITRLLQFWTHPHAQCMLLLSKEWCVQRDYAKCNDTEAIPRKISVNNDRLEADVCCVDVTDRHKVLREPSAVMIIGLRHLVSFTAALITLLQLWHHHEWSPHTPFATFMHQWHKNYVPVPRRRCSNRWKTLVSGDSRQEQCHSLAMRLLQIPKFMIFVLRVFHYHLIPTDTICPLYVLRTPNNPLYIVAMESDAKIYVYPISRHWTVTCISKSRNLRT
jgi:hypothetical protein